MEIRQTNQRTKKLFHMVEQIGRQSAPQALRRISASRGNARANRGRAT
jgi:hypothetical protein